MTDTRIDPPLVGPERESLRAWLDWHRGTLEHKCAGLTDEQLRLTAAAPSQLSLLGLVRHLAEVERTWFRRVFAREDVPLVWSADGDFQVAYDATDASVDEAWAAWRSEVARPARSRPPPSRWTSPVTRPSGARTSPCAGSWCT